MWVTGVKCQEYQRRQDIFAILFEDSNYELCSVDRASLYNLVNETILVQDLFLVYFVKFFYNLYKFRTSRCPSLGGRTVYMRHLVLSGMQDGISFHPAY
jgi:hypothetical protein